MMDPLCTETCWSILNIFTILILPMNYILVPQLDSKKPVYNLKFVKGYFKYNIKIGANDIDCEEVNGLNGLRLGSIGLMFPC